MFSADKIKKNYKIFNIRVGKKFVKFIKFKSGQDVKQFTFEFWDKIKKKNFRKLKKKTKYLKLLRKEFIVSILIKNLKSIY